MKKTKKKSHEQIKLEIIDNTYVAIDQINKVLGQQIDKDQTDPEKIRQIVLGKEQAQSALTAMMEKLRFMEEEMGIIENKATRADKLQLGPEKK